MWCLRGRPLGSRRRQHSREQHVDACARCRERLRSLEAVCEGLRGISDLPAVPERIGPYEVSRLIGQGATGFVFEAFQASPPRWVAIKVLRPLRQFDEATLRAFRREIKTLARLEHPSIVSIYDAGQTNEGAPLLHHAHGRGAADRSLLRPGWRLRT